jgi:hypothetical protein
VPAGVRANGFIAGHSALLWLLRFWAIGNGVIRLTPVLPLPRIAGMPMVIKTVGARPAGPVVLW